MWFCDFGKKLEYSIKYAHGNMKTILPLLKSRQQKYFAVSDYGEISCWPSVYFTCKENGIVPILGMETFVNNYGMFGKDGELYLKKITEGWSKNIKEVSDEEKDYSTIDFSLDIFARTIEGYYNIIQIHNDAQMNGMQNRPRTNDKFIHEHGKGIVCVFPNPYSEVCSKIYNGLTKEAQQKLDFYRSVFDEVYVSIPIVEDENYKEINDLTIEFCKSHGVKMIPVCNSHYHLPEDEEALNVFRKISKIKGGLSYEVDFSKGMYYKTRTEVRQTYEKYLKSDVFTDKIFEQICEELDRLLKSFTLLDIDVTPKMPKFKDGDKILREKAYEGLRLKGLDKKREYIERLEYELDNVIKAGFADYFLFLEDLYRWYRQQRHRTPSAGRGSGGGSLVLYCLGVMNVDPLKYNLLFERFLDASRLQAIIEKGQKVTAEQYPDVDCFTLDTLVLTPNGPKEIGDLHIGDKVITRENEVKKITNEVVHKNCPIVRVCYGSWYVDTTYNHKFLIKRNDKFYYEYVMNLREDDFLVESNNVLIPIIAIIDKSNVLKLVKDIEIEGEHCFRVCGKTFNKVELINGQITEQKIHETGVVVHNCDFPGEEKDHVREYFISKYGKNNVCHIGTVGYLKLRGCLKELSRLYEIPLQQVNQLTTEGLKQLDKEDEGKPIQVLRQKCKALDAFLKKYPKLAQVFDKIYGAINCWGIHAGGMLVTDFDLTKQLPVRVTDGKLVSCWTEGISGRELGQMGFIKMDILAIDALSTIEKTIELINTRHGTDWSLYSIPIDEKSSLDQLNHHDAIGVFQFDSPVAMKVIDNMGGVKSFEDLAVVNTLARPAALINGFDKLYGQTRKNADQIFIPKELQSTMGATYGLPIFQESVYHYAKQLAGFDKVNAYVLMKKIYKNKLHNKEDVEYWKNKFVDGCKDKIKRDVIEVQFEDGSKKQYETGEQVICTDGIKRSIEQALEQGKEF